MSFLRLVLPKSLVSSMSLVVIGYELQSRIFGPAFMWYVLLVSAVCHLSNYSFGDILSIAIAMVALFFVPPYFTFHTAGWPIYNHPRCFGSVKPQSLLFNSPHHRPHSSIHISPILASRHHQAHQLHTHIATFLRFHNPLYSITPFSSESCYSLPPPLISYLWSSNQFTQKHLQAWSESLLDLPHYQKSNRYHLYTAPRLYLYPRP